MTAKEPTAATVYTEGCSDTAKATNYNGHLQATKARRTNMYIYKREHHCIECRCTHCRLYLIRVHGVHEVCCAKDRPSLKSKDKVPGPAHTSNMNSQTDCSGAHSHGGFSQVSVHLVPGRLEAVAAMRPPQQRRQCLQTYTTLIHHHCNEGYTLLFIRLLHRSA